MLVPCFRRGSRAVRRARPSFELLEDRTVPSTFTVLNLADSGTGSLRQAILAANASAGADTILFAAGLSGTLTLSSGEMSITDDLALAGPGASQLTVSGNQLSRAFRISGSTTDVAVSGLTIADGLATGRTALGGGIFNDGGHLTLTAMTFIGNQVVGDDHPHAAAGGGAVASVYGATLAVTGCTFTGNGSVANRRSEGGAVLSDVGSTLTVGSSQFAGNQSLALVDNHERSFWFGGFGGAVATLGGGAATFSATTFTGNRALGGAGEPGRDGVIAQAGAINNAVSLLAEGLGALAGTLQIDQSTFTENEAVGGAGGPSVGGSAGGSGGYGLAGAVYNDVGGRVTITDSAFAGNRSRGGVGGHATGTAHGGTGGVAAGAAIVSFRGHLIVRGSTFVENRASGGTGGSSQEQGGTGGRARGGAIHTPGFDGYFPPGEEAVTELEHVTFLRNQASGGAGGDGGAGTGGNGHFGRGGALSVNVGTLIVRHCLLDSNTASGGQGGAGATPGRGHHGVGGGISNGEPVETVGQQVRNFLFVSDSTLTNNRAIGGAGSVGGFGRGGGIDNAGRATATIIGTLIADNQAVGGSGTVTGGDGIGGGLYNEVRSDVTLRGCTVTSNQALGGSGPTAGRGIGGGIYNTPGGTVWVDVLTLIFANNASTSEDDVFGILTPL
jgi:fibronectin-binding autotransporter adhesin